MSKHLVFAVFLLFTAIRAGAWTEGELLVWTTDNRGYRAMAELGKKFEEEMGVAVKVETQEGITDKFQAAAQTGKGPGHYFLGA